MDTRSMGVGAGSRNPDLLYGTEPVPAGQRPVPATRRRAAEPGHLPQQLLLRVFFQCGPYHVDRGRTGTDNFFTFDVRSSCKANEVTLQLVRGAGATFESPYNNYFGSASYAIHDVTTPAAVVNNPSGTPWSSPASDYTFYANAFRVFQDLEDGPSYGEFPYPEEGSPSDVLSFHLNQAGVDGFNAVRGGFFTVGGSGGGRSYVAGNQAIYRDPIFGGDVPGKLILTCSLPTSKNQCKNGGWQDFGVFKNQGDCVSFVATGGKNPPANSP